MGVGFPRRVGRYRYLRVAVFVPGLLYFHMYGRIMTQGWDIVLPECAGASTLARGATPVARWLCESQPNSNQWMGVGVPNHAGRYRTGYLPSSSLGCWS